MGSHHWLHYAPTLSSTPAPHLHMNQLRQICRFIETNSTAFSQSIRLPEIQQWDWTSIWLWRIPCSSNTKLLPLLPDWESGWSLLRSSHSYRLRQSRSHAGCVNEGFVHLICIYTLAREVEGPAHHSTFVPAILVWITALVKSHLIRQETLDGWVRNGLRVLQRIWVRVGWGCRWGCSLQLH